MVSEVVIIPNPTGLHARPATQVVKRAKQYASKISIHAGDRNADAKSIFSLLLCCFQKGEEITVHAEGPDEEKALREITACIRSLEG